MRQSQKMLHISSRGQGLYEFTHEAKTFVTEAGIETGLLTVFCQHTSCSLLIQENADPDVQVDMQGFFQRLVPEGMDWIVHVMEGSDDMPAHIKTALTDVSINIPVRNGQLVLGTWQGIYLFEHRRHQHDRQIVLHIVGE